MTSIRQIPYQNEILSALGVIALIAWFLMPAPLPEQVLIIRGETFGDCIPYDLRGVDGFMKAEISTGRRRFMQIEMTGNKAEDSSRLLLAQQQLQDIVNRRDTLVGIHILYGPKAKYWSMVRALDFELREPSIQCVIGRSGVWATYQPVRTSYANRML